MLSDQRRFDHELVKGYRIPTREQQPSLNALIKHPTEKHPPIAFRQGQHCYCSGALGRMWVTRSAFTHRITPESTSAIWKRLCIDGLRAAPPQWMTWPIHQSLPGISPVRESWRTTTVIPGATSRKIGVSEWGELGTPRSADIPAKPGHLY